MAERSCGVEALQDCGGGRGGGGGGGDGGGGGGAPPGQRLEEARGRRSEGAAPGADGMWGRGERRQGGRAGRPAGAHSQDAAEDTPLDGRHEPAAHCW